MNLAEGLVEEIRRCRDVVLPAYLETGPAGAIAASMIKSDICEGENALASGDVVRIVKAYSVLKDVAL